MLQQLRDTTKSIVSSILLILLVISFGIWGIGDIFRIGSGKDWIAKVDGHKIPPQVVDKEFRNEVAQMRMVLGPNFTAEKAKEMGLLERALERVLLTTSLNLETNRLGFHVPSSEIVKTLEKAKELRNPDGTFNRDMFLRVLSQQGLTEPQFIDLQKQIAARNTLIRSLAMPITVPDAVNMAMAEAAAQKRVAEIARVNYTALAAAPYPSDEEMEKFYNEKKERYLAPEARSFKRVTLTTADIGKGLDVNEEELKKAYEERGNDFNTPEKRDITQVVLSSEEEAKAFKLAAALGLAAAAKAGGKEAVKLEAVAKADLPASLGEAAFTAASGKTAGPVETSFGWHVFVVDKVTPDKTRTFEDVKAELKAQLQKDHAAESMVQTANKMDDLLAAGKSVDEVASTLGLKLENFENLAENGKAFSDKSDGKPAISFLEETLKAAFQYGEGETSPLIESKDGGYILVNVTKVNAAAPQPLAEIRARVGQDWQNANKAKRAEGIAAKVMEEMKAGKPLAEIRGEGVVVKTSAPLVADNQEQKEFPREALAPLFDLRRGEVAAISTPEGEVVVRVKDIIPADKKDVEARLEAMKTRLNSEWQSTHVDELALALRAAHPPEVDEAGLKAMAATAQ